MDYEEKTFKDLTKYADSVSVKPSELLKIYTKVSKNFYEKEHNKGNTIPLNNKKYESKLIELCELEILDRISSKE